MTESVIMQPTLGRIVIYNATGDLKRAAVVIAIKDKRTGLHVYAPPGGEDFKCWADHDPTGKKSGTWSWPNRLGQPS